VVTQVERRTRDLRIGNFRSNLESNRQIVVYSFNVKFLLTDKNRDVRIRQIYCAIATRLLAVVCML